MTMPILPDWQQGMYLIGQDPDGAPILVQTDATGNIVAVFKGMGPDGLITLKADAEGRLVAIVTDPEDVFGVFRSMGLAELAARIGPQIPADRRGDIVYRDDFESGIAKWQIAGSGSNYAVEPSVTLARSGAYSVMLQGGSSATRYVSLGRRLPFQVIGLMGFEAHLALVANVERIQIWYYIYDGTNYSQFAIELDLVTDDINYWDDTPDWVKLTDMKFTLAADAGFIPVKMVFDTVNDKYIRCIVNGEQHLMTDLIPYTDTLSVMKYSHISVVVYSTAGNNGVAYLDDIIVTQNEPPNPEE